MPAPVLEHRSQISVIIPTHNRAELLRVAIASVLASPLIETPCQIIVVDDDSHDHTQDVARESSVRYLRVASHNVSLARNAGFEVARSPYVTFLDDDDAWLPENMLAQLSALEAHPGAGFAYGISRCATEDLTPLPWTFPSPPLVTGLDPNRLHLGYPQVGTVLFRREVIDEVNGFDPRIPYQQDADLMLRVATRHAVIGIEVTGMLFRLRPPTRARADYHWSMRGVINWVPTGAGLRWSTHARFILLTRRLFFNHFLQIAEACVSRGCRRDALVCILRAVAVAPHQALRHPRRVASVLRNCAGASSSRGSTNPQPRPNAG